MKKKGRCGEKFLPHNVFNLRKKRLNALTTTSIQGIVIRSIIVLTELIGYGYFHSTALLLDAICSLIDVIASISFLFFIYLADKPPDKDHPLGHGRYEPIAGMQLSLLLILIGLGLGCQQAFSFFHLDLSQSMHPYAYLIPLVIVFLLEFTYRRLRRTAKREKSSALLTEAWHYRLDALSSAIAAIALSAAIFAPSIGVLFDHIGAFVISLLMIVVGYCGARQNSRQLVDRIPDQHYFDLVCKAALSVKGVKGTDKVRIQLYGPDAHIAIDIEVNAMLSVKEAHEIAQKVRLAIQKNFPAVRDAIVHVEPHLPSLTDSLPFIEKEIALKEQDDGVAET